MNKLALSFITAFTSFLVIGCSDKSVNDDNKVEVKPSSAVESEISQSEATLKESDKIKQNSDSINIPIHILKDDPKEVKYIEVKKDSTLQEKIESIIKVLSKECFNSLPMKVKLYPGNSKVRIELIEPKTDSESRVSWKKDYLNETTKEYTINTIVKNIIQEDYKGDWIKEVQLYYDGKLISLD
ncbi:MULTISPECIES: hypothetical protein [Romboutsia]|uniref:Prokaryotic membrane lipoprotein lipid attachment site profile n=1 Tax=Romboutsia hominis TaxID=1507512 RepID=A0A2P2BT31_9FIRM|nr:MULTISPECIES: hypothetical protein [Romboutsia]MDB8793686.1 hypothetical protein [Romboutsia sp. 1001216sp1]MDB8795083.1 hypothetical protein [Romboutsia sp. 1001216sp1]MDB8798893.1 hypothetical protein [Romboutsia sp. 1001216sp1]CEI73506.1 Prokaryotic membrane lipoprotein lipid attachment site profile [Romboutsia hominis]